MALADIEIREPADVPKIAPELSVLVNHIAIRPELLLIGLVIEIRDSVVVRHLEQSVSAMVSKPDLIFLKQRKYVFCRRGVLIADNDELFIMLNQVDRYSLNRENGGFVATISASSRSSRHSRLRKSPSPSSFSSLFSPFLNSSATSSISTPPLPVAS